jgi:hypothetical protein
MLDKRMQDGINSQINWELYSGYLYLSMASKFADMGMSGGQNWMTVQYQEELAHARIMFSYVLTRGGRVILDAIGQPETEWPNGLAMFEDALGHEEGVTARIHDIRWRSSSRTTPYNFLGGSPSSSRGRTAGHGASSRWRASACGPLQLDKSSTRVYNAPRRWWPWTPPPA